MSAHHVFLVIGSEYESSCVFAAFTAKKDAEAMVARCLAYQATERPTSPEDIVDSAENDAEWERFIKQDDKWERRHPAGKYATHYDHWNVQRIRVREPSRTHAKGEALNMPDGAETTETDRKE